MPTLNPELVYQLPPERKVPAASREPLPEDWLTQLIQVTLDNFESQPSFDLSARIAEHIGEQSTYEMKDQIIEGLKPIYSVMVDASTIKDYKAAIAFKLIERAENCTPGFHDGVNSIVEGFERPESIDALLHRIRHDIVSKTANQTTDEVHGNNRFFTVAQTDGYGVRALNPKDIYRGDITDRVIQNKLAASFSRDYRLLNILSGMEDQIYSELLMSGYTRSGPKTPDIMEKSLDFLTMLFKDAPAVIKQHEALSRQDTYNQACKDFMVANRAKVGELISGLTSENLIDALIKNQFPVVFKLKYLDRLDEETKNHITEIQQDYRKFYEKMKPLATRMNEDKVLTISPFQRELLESDKLELNWSQIKQTIREELCVKQYLSLTAQEESALDALLNTDVPFNSKYYEDLELNGSEVVTLLKMDSLGDEKKKGLLDWYIREGKDSPEDKLTSLAPIQNMGKHNTSIRSVLDEHGSLIDNLMAALRQDWLTKLSAPEFEFQDYSIPVYLSQDKAFMLAAVKQNGFNLQYASDALRSDRDVVLAAVMQCPAAFQYASFELQKDKTILLELAKQNIRVIKHFPQAMLDEKDVMITVIEQHSEALAQRYPVELRGDKTFMLTAVKQDEWVILLASETLQGDIEFILEAAALNVTAIKFFPMGVREDKKVMLALTMLNINAVQYASEVLKGDKDFMLEACKRSFRLLAYASEALKGDKDFMLEAYKHNEDALLYAPEALKGDKDFMLEVSLPLFGMLQQH